MATLIVAKVKNLKFEYEIEWNGNKIILLFRLQFLEKK